jgi:hypothetical protein
MEGLAMANTLEFSELQGFALLRGKIGWICHAIRWLVVLWSLWLLYLNLIPLESPAEAAVEWNKYWGLKEGSITVGEVFINRGFALASWLASALVALAVWRLTGGYLQGDILSAEAARKVRLVGVWGLVAIVVDIAIRAPMLAVLSTEIPGRIPFLDWFSTHDVFYTVIALFMLSLGHIQGTAAAISDEHRQIV